MKLQGYFPNLTKSNVELNSKEQNTSFIELGAIEVTEQDKCEKCTEKECNCKN